MSHRAVDEDDTFLWIGTQRDLYAAGIAVRWFTAVTLLGGAAWLMSKLL